MNKYWIPLFSHSGTEVAELIDHTKILPHMILTDRKKLDGMDKRLIREFVYSSDHINLMEMIYSDVTLLSNRDFLITLHGYMRIIPPEIIDLPNVKIYNVHPGNIVRYPELRGKDPQERTIKGKYPIAGVVIHEVDAGIDTGKIIASREIEVDPIWEVNDLVKVLRGLSIEMWKDILK